jgi:hypothetical protein
MTDPRLLMDFLTDSYNAGKVQLREKWRNGCDSE